MTLEERERRAYADGQVELAALLALADDLERELDEALKDPPDESDTEG